MPTVEMTNDVTCPSCNTWVLFNSDYVNLHWENQSIYLYLYVVDLMISLVMNITSEIILWIAYFISSWSYRNTVSG